MGMQTIRNEQIVVINDLSGIAEVWRRYCQKLYEDNFNPMDRDVYPIREPTIMREEIERAIRLLKQKKSPGANGRL